MKYSVDVDTRTFIRFWLVILALAILALFIWKALSGLIIVGIAIFLAIAIQPLAMRIKHLTKKTTSFSSVMAYVIIVLAIALILAVVAPVVAGETFSFVQQLPQTFDSTLGGWDGINNLGQAFGIDNLQNEIAAGIQVFANNIVGNLGNFMVSSVGAITQAITATILTLVLTLLFAIEGPDLVKSFWKLISTKRDQARVTVYQRLCERLAGVISTYVTKQVTVALLDGIVVAVVVFLLSLIFGFSGSLAIPLGLISLVFYLIPMFGQIISCILIAAVLFFSSPIAALVYLVFYIIYAQIENNLIAPKLQGDALHLPTAIVLSSIVIGMYMFGLIGAIIAIPIAGCIKVVLEELPNLREAHSLKA